MGHITTRDIRFRPRKDGTTLSTNSKTEILDLLIENTLSRVLEWKKTRSGRSDVYTAKLSEEASVQICTEPAGPMLSTNLILELRHSSYTNSFIMRFYAEAVDVAKLLRSLFEFVSQRANVRSVSVSQKIPGFVSAETALEIAEKALGVGATYATYEFREEVTTVIPESIRRAFADDAR